MNFPVGDGSAQLHSKDVVSPLIGIVNYIFSKSVCYN